MAGRKGMRKYSITLKEEAVRMHVEDGLTIKEINKLLNIADDQRVKKWCAIYRKHGMEGLQPRPKGRPRITECNEQQQMEHELQRLKMENELLRNFLYEAERR